MNSDATHKLPNDALNTIACHIVRLRLQAPATFFLEMHKPLGSLIHTAALFIQPTVAPFFGAERVAGFTKMLSSPDFIETLISHIETISQSNSEATILEGR